MANITFRIKHVSSGDMVKTTITLKENASLTISEVESFIKTFYGDSYELVDREKLMRRLERLNTKS